MADIQYTEAEQERMKRLQDIGEDLATARKALIQASELIGDSIAHNCRNSKEMNTFIDDQHNVNKALSHVLELQETINRLLYGMYFTASERANKPEEASKK